MASNNSSAYVLAAMRRPDFGKILSESTVRLAVTGLSQAGKTVFITSLVHNLLSAAANPAVLPLFRARLGGGLVGARLVPTEERPFPYAELLRSFADDPPRWPASTTGTSALRIAIRYRPRSFVWGMLAPFSTLNLDIVDYPGEWLLDLPLLEQSFEEWSQAMMSLCREEPRASAARPWLDFITAQPDATEANARAAAELYAAYLRRCRTEHGLSLLQPGRFLSPGEHWGSTLLQFCPLTDHGAPLHAKMRERYERYRKEIVERFYVEHFRRFDRQVVLVDVLRALNIGPAAFEDARRALASVLRSFRFGRSNILARLVGGARIDRVLFLATKADHVAPSQFANLRQLLAKMTVEAGLDMKFAGARAETGVVAAVRCTEPGRGSYEGKSVGLVKGVLEGETTPTVLYAGEVPSAPPPHELWATQRPDFPNFRPPRLDPRPGEGVPQLGLDEALDYLLGDRFA
jgi:predicted YcjX-like family ATPase